jgi:hypothetical protein
MPSFRTAFRRGSPTNTGPYWSPGTCAPPHRGYSRAQRIADSFRSVLCRHRYWTSPERLRFLETPSQGRRLRTRPDAGASELLKPPEKIDGSGGAADIGGRTAAITLPERAAEIHNVLDPIAREMRATAVLQTDIGRIIAGGVRDLTPAQRNLLSADEIASQAPGVHAEITALAAAEKLRATPQGLAVTRAICPECAEAIEASGGILTSSKTAIWPRP